MPFKIFNSFHLFLYLFYLFIDLNSMSNSLVVFYARRLGNRFIVRSFNFFVLFLFLHTVIVIHLSYCLDVVQGRVNGVPYETRTLSWRFASLAY